MGQDIRTPNFQWGRHLDSHTRPDKPSLALLIGANEADDTWDPHLLTPSSSLRSIIQEVVQSNKKNSVMGFEPCPPNMRMSLCLAYKTTPHTFALCF